VGRLAVRIAAAAPVIFFAAAAHAGELVISAEDGTPWSSLVTQIQADPSSQGRVYHLEVDAGMEPARCGDYTLELDAVSAQAFRLEGCDPATNRTALRVVDRAALFEQGDVVPRPRVATVRATMIVRSEAVGGGGTPAVRADVACTVALAPMLYDELHGVKIPLTPDRFDVQVLDGAVSVDVEGDAWEARGEGHAALAFRYQATDRATGEVVLTSTATLECADTPETPLASATPTVTSVGAAYEPNLGMRWTLTGFTNVAWLTRSTRGITTDAGMPLPSASLDYYGTSLGYDFSFSWFSFLLRYTIGFGSGGMASVWDIGIGVTHKIGALTIIAAPTLRCAMMSVDGVIGPDVELDPALTVGLRWKLGGSRWEFMAETAAPIRDSTEWLTVIGFDWALGI
jgi:hypothetical protein